MQILLSCAKDMTPVTEIVSDIATVPMFLEEALANASLMAQFSPEELGKLLKISPALAFENYQRYRQIAAYSGSRTGTSMTFSSAESLGEGQAAFSYTGVAYRHLKSSSWSEDDALFANEHLFITSFLYGLLRPMDMIRLYRLEGGVRLRDGKTMFEFWKPLLTEALLKAVKADDGVLVHLATEEMTRLFDWKRVCSEIKVIEPRFLAKSGDKLKVVTVHAKMCRGAMANYIIRNRISDPKALKTFTYDGYTLASSDIVTSSDTFTSDTLTFVNNN